MQYHDIQTQSQLFQAAMIQAIDHLDFKKMFFDNKKKQIDNISQFYITRVVWSCEPRLWTSSLIFLIFSF